MPGTNESTPKRGKAVPAYVIDPHRLQLILLVGAKSNIAKLGCPENSTEVVLEYTNELFKHSERDSKTDMGLGPYHGPFPGQKEHNKNILGHIN